MHKILYAYYTSPYTASHLSYLLLSCLYTRILKGVHIPVVEVCHDLPPYRQHLIVYVVQYSYSTVQYIPVVAFK